METSHIICPSLPRWTAEQPGWEARPCDCSTCTSRPLCQFGDYFSERQLFSSERAALCGDGPLSRVTSHSVRGPRLLCGYIALTELSASANQVSIV